jgi:hypothetical protein
MPKLNFEGRLESDQGAHFIRVPADVLAALGKGKRVPVKVTINGFTYQTTVAVYGGRYYLGVRREVREAARASAGDLLRVAVEYDAEVRTVDLPDDLAVALLAKPGAVAAFEALSYTYKRELVSWVSDAKRPETRQRRIAQALRMLQRGRSKT